MSPYSICMLFRSTGIFCADWLDWHSEENVFIVVHLAL